MSHLEENNQTYWEHNKDALNYSKKAFKASMYFFIHAFFPDKYTTKGSREIISLSSSIQMKKESLNEYLLNKNLLNKKKKESFKKKKE
jgi:hypothetical protein